MVMFAKRVEIENTNFYKLTVLYDESKSKFYKRFKTRFLVRTCMYK